MAAPHVPSERSFPPPELDGFLPTDIDWNEVQEHDAAMIAELHVLNRRTSPVRSLATGLDFPCGELAGLARRSYDAPSIEALEQFLTEHGTIHVPVIEGYSVAVDGVERDLALVAATEIAADGANHGEMSSMIYLRDQIQAAEALIKLSLADPDHYAQEGKTGKSLLVSALHLMSTPSQLERFDDVIHRGAQAGQADWPQISLYFDDLAGERPNGWRNKQDTLQMLAYTTLTAVEQGVLNADELADGHRRFLGSVAPLLAAVGFPRYESSGSWEEVAARRTSVLAIETALLHKLQSVSDGRYGLGFLRNVMVGHMLTEGLHELGSRLPYESDDYDSGSVKFRDGDAALAYVLRYDLPQLLAENNIPLAVNGGAAMSVDDIEDLVLGQLETLLDPQTNGIYRYEGDSYQRVNFHTGGVQFIIKAIKRKVQHDAAVAGSEIDLDVKQSLRDKLAPAGRPAAWTHPLGQVASWASSRSRQMLEAGETTEAEQYGCIGYRFLNAMLSTVTGSDQWHAVLDTNGQYEIRQVSAYRMPECYVTYTTVDGQSFCMPSPHIPLNWSSGYAPGSRRHGASGTMSLFIA